MAERELILIKFKMPSPNYNNTTFVPEFPEHKQLIAR